MMMDASFQQTRSAFRYNCIFLQERISFDIYFCIFSQFNGNSVNKIKSILNFEPRTAENTRHDGWPPVWLVWFTPPLGECSLVSYFLPKAWPRWASSRRSTAMTSHTFPTRSPSTCSSTSTGSIRCVSLDRLRNSKTKMWTKTVYSM